jgi:hypothetical protein
LPEGKWGTKKSDRGPPNLLSHEKGNQIKLQQREKPPCPRMMSALLQNPTLMTVGSPTARFLCDAQLSGKVVPAPEGATPVKFRTRRTRSKIQSCPGLRGIVRFPLSATHSLLFLGGILCPSSWGTVGFKNYTLHL